MFQEHKWKMYLEIDQEEEEEEEDTNVLTLVKEVTFSCKSLTQGSFKLSQVDISWYS